MIKVNLSNEILRYILEIDKYRYDVSSVKLPVSISDRLRKNSKKKSSYASNKIEGNPLSFDEVDEVVVIHSLLHVKLYSSFQGVIFLVLFNIRHC